MSQELSKNCPNCGAPIEAGLIKCPFCGTSYYDLSTMPTDKPFMLTVNVDGIRYVAKVSLENISYSRAPFPYELPELTMNFIVRSMKNNEL